MMFRPEAIIGEGDRMQLDTFSSSAVGSIEIAKCAIFSTNCAILCDKRAHFCEGVA